MKTKALTLVALCLSLSTNAWAITAGEACNSATDTNTCENGTLFICPSQDYPTRVLLKTNGTPMIAAAGMRAPLAAPSAR